MRRPCTPQRNWQQPAVGALLLALLASVAPPCAADAAIAPEVLALDCPIEHRPQQCQVPIDRGRFLPSRLQISHHVFDIGDVNLAELPLPEPGPHS